MEMEEHPPPPASWGNEPGKLPIIRSECPLSHLGARSAYGTVQWKWSSHSGGLVTVVLTGVKPTHVAPLDKSL